MARREYTNSYRCAETGCRETTFYIYDTRREQAESMRRQNEHPWKCLRHSQPDRMLAPDSEPREVVITASKVAMPGYERDLAEYERQLAIRAPYERHYLRKPKQFLDGLYWMGDTAKSGLASGPGFMAFASDFPEGTRVVISIRVELPAVPSDFDEEVRTGG